MATLLVFVVTLFGLSRAQYNCHNLDFGQCSDPSISFGYNFSGAAVWGYETNNHNDFPHGWTPEIATLELFICNQLQSPCNAPTDTLYACRGALNELSSLTGQSAVDAWNNALGLSNNDSDDCGATTVYIPGYVATTTTTVYASEPATSALTTVTITALTTSTSTYTSYASASLTVTPNATLTITITLPLPTSTNSTNVEESSVYTVTETQISYTVATTSASVTATGARHSQSSSQASSTSKGDNIGGDSPFNSSAPAPFCSQMLCALVGLLTLLTAS
ncbi:hypothetical protein DV736_g5013, partial [Chaetothyriales sp. CBS 134916]